MYLLSLSLQKAGILKTPRIIRSFERIDRIQFVPRDYHYAARYDCALPLGKNATISAPHIHVMVAEHLEYHLQAGSTVLDIGCGSGYLSCLFSDLVEPGIVIGADINLELVRMSINNSAKIDRFRKKIISGDLTFLQDNARNMRFAPEAMFDVIHVGAMARHVPTNLISGLKVGGCMIIPVNGFLKKINRISFDKYKEIDLECVNFVPLI